MNEDKPEQHQIGKGMLGAGLTGQTAVVTGGGAVPGRGMGRAISLALAAAGVRVVAVDIDAGAAEDTVRAIAEAGGEALAVHADVGRREDIVRIGSEAEARFGVVDILVNHVGIGNHLSLLDTTDDWWDRALAVNLTAPFLTARQFLPGMLAKGRGVIINTISICGMVGGRAGAAYTASKHGLVGLTRNIAAAYSQQGIRCVGVAPGSVRSGEANWNSSEGRIADSADLSGIWPSLRQALELSPRRGTPDEIAGAVVFLASDHASFINGAVLPIDGGWTAI